MGLFKDCQDIAIAISTDGAQLTVKKQSDTWLLLVILLNLPARIRYKSGNTIIAFSTPGSPGDMESFLYPLFVEMAMASERIWTWDAVDSSYFVNRAVICMALGDMLGSAKLNGMAGHSAIFGDRFSMVKGACASLAKGSKAQYYPMTPPEPLKYNSDFPSYNLHNLPMRVESEYWGTIDRLLQATSKSKCAAITKETGVSHMPLCAASLALFTQHSFLLIHFIYFMKMTWHSFGICGQSSAFLLILYTWIQRRLNYLENMFLRQWLHFHPHFVALFKIHS